MPVYLFLCGVKQALRQEVGGGHVPEASTGILKIGNLQGHLPDQEHTGSGGPLPPGPKKETQGSLKGTKTWSDKKTAPLSKCFWASLGT